MPIDMTTVKQIMHNNKEVAKIEDLNGNIMWQKVQAKVLSSITLSGYTTVFTKGSTFSFGGTVTAHYSDSTTANVTSSTTFSGYNMNSNGTQTVTASYTENGVTKTATYQILVRQQVTSTVTWNRTEVINNVYTVSSTSTKTNTVKFVTEATFNNSCASKLGINVDQIISKGTYKWVNYWKNGITYANSQSTLMWKTSNSTSGSNWYSRTDTRTASSSESQSFTITTTPAWNTTLYPAFSYKISSTNYGPYMCSGSNVTYARTHSSYSWSFSCSVTYWKYTN